jgi:hypothetical protein
MAELFENVEVNREPRWRTLVQITGASLVLHLVLVWAVVYVPAIRDTVNIAALIASTKFVEKPYNRTEIGDEVQLVELSEKFRYPDGYFAMDTEVDSESAASAVADPFAPKIISQAAAEKPEPSPSPTQIPSPSPAASASASPQVAAEESNANKNPTELTPEEAQKELDRTAEANNLELPDD